MTDRSTFDPFEQRLARDLARYVAPAVDPRAATEIADAAMQPRGVLVRARNTSTRRRMLLLGVAAALLIPAVYVGAGGTRPAPAMVPGPSETVLPQGAVVSVFVRRVTDPTPGVAVLAVDADGAERLIRHVPDSLVNGTLAEWGTVSGTGWLALAVEKNPWPMVLIDLRDERSAPWVVTEASTGGIGPRWGPTGLIAADAGGNGSRVIIADPGKHTTRIISSGGLIGGGPSIVWVGDGSGIVTSGGPAGYQVVPIDGSDPHPGVGDVFDPRGVYGSDLARLRICTPDAGCRGAADGRVERVELDDSTKTVWQQQGPDRALGAGFGNAAGEYWVTTSHADGKELGIVHVQSDQLATSATVNRGASWQYVSYPVEAPDHSVAVLWLDIGAKSAAAIVPLDGGPQTFHTGQFAGFVASGAIAESLVAGRSAAPGQPVPAVRDSYHLESLDELIAAEQQLNPGRQVLAAGSHDAVAGDNALHDTTVQRDKRGTGELHLDCFGPTSATVTVGRDSQTDPCLSVGAYIIQIDAGSPIVVTASGDTSWRVAVYTP